MENIEKYIDAEKIIFYLCRIRAKMARQRNKAHLVHLLSSDKKYNYHINTKKYKEKEEEDLKTLYRILPSRRKWIKLNKKNRYNNNQRIDSEKYNIKSLLLTIEYYKKKNPDEPFLLELNKFIKDIQDSINDPAYIIESPEIIPQLKDKNSEEKICRPISNYNLKDKLIIGLVNKYLTDIFDNYFYSNSFAFRATQLTSRGKKVLSHHDAIQSVLDYKKKYKGKRLWVAECDINKFYDSVHHEVARKQFQVLILKVKKNTPELYDERVERIFYKYLDSYTFVRNVLPYNSANNDDYWLKHKIPGGSFGWIERKLIEQGHFKNSKNAKIGVPQGGAISGLIANIVLNFADIQINKLCDSKLFYARFCDDMILIHPSKKKCKIASDLYIDTLKKLHLIPHSPCDEESIRTQKSFWDGTIKSKPPYKWSVESLRSFPWFGFVGYEIHYSGDLRVRKKSLNKEKDKQKEVVCQIIKAINKGKRKNDGTIFESAVNRLIGMSVGRINLSNYDDVKNEMCWINGFKKLNNNRHLRAQLKDLDRNRSKQLSRLLKAINEKEISEQKNTIIRIRKLAFMRINGLNELDSISIRNLLVASKILNSNFQLRRNIDLDDENLNFGLGDKYEIIRPEIIEILKNPFVENRKIVFYGSPFSYYYQLIERDKHA